MSVINPNQLNPNQQVTLTDEIILENQKKSQLNKTNAWDILWTVLLSILALSILFPFYNAILVSLVPQRTYIITPFMLFPKEIIWDSYKFVFTSRLIWSSLGNSVIITIVGTSYNMFLTVLCGYALTKNIPGRRIIRFFIVFTMYFSGGVIPFFLLIKNVGLMDQLGAMIIPTGINIFYMLVISSFFKTIPASLEESAKLDGAGNWRILLMIILPLSLPLLATFTLYYAVDRWNEWYFGMLFITSV